MVPGTRSSDQIQHYTSASRTSVWVCGSRSRSILAGLALLAVLTGCQTQATLPDPTPPTLSELDKKVQSKCATYERLHLAVVLAEAWVADRHLNARQQTILRDARKMADAACEFEGETTAGRVADMLMKLAEILEQGG